jgi:2-dehydro-3-deoxyphosphogluconate aldolase/(4S)-4-hydroxy-2-oxoglutarate aldolase
MPPTTALDYHRHTMTPDEYLDVLRVQRASAVLRTNHADRAAPAMQAAIDGGFRVVEFTLTIPDALDRIREFAQQPGVFVGAGTVLTVDDAQRAVDAGAAFLVSPVVDEAVIAAAVAMNIAIMPGTHTPTEMYRAYRAGANVQKLFPAPGIGPAFVKACLGPMPFLNIVPTHGVHENNAASYLKAGACAVGFVASLFQQADLDAARYDVIEQRAAKLLASVA